MAAIVFYAVLLLAVVALSDVNHWVTAVLLLSVLGGFLGNAYLTRGRAEYSGGKREPKSMVAGIMDILLGAPDQLRLSFNCLEKCRRLCHCDVTRVSVILLWLFDRRHKATVEELCATLTADEAVRILPVLRDISGVIRAYLLSWRSYALGGVAEMKCAVALNLKTRPGSSGGVAAVRAKPPPKKPRWESRRGNHNGNRPRKTTRGTARRVRREISQRGKDRLAVTLGSAAVRPLCRTVKKWVSRVGQNLSS